MQDIYVAGSPATGVNLGGKVRVRLALNASLYASSTCGLVSSFLARALVPWAKHLAANFHQKCQENQDIWKLRFRHESLKKEEINDPIATRGRQATKGSPNLDPKVSRRPILPKREKRRTGT